MERQKATQVATTNESIRKSTTLSDFQKLLTKPLRAAVFDFRQLFRRLRMNISTGTLEVERNREFWFRFLYAPEEELTDADWYMAHVLAERWDTCACGSMDDGIPRGHGNMPYDTELKFLGCRFPEIIQRRDLEGAREMFKLIEERAAEVIRRNAK